MRPGLFQYDPQPGVVPPGSISNAELAAMAALTVKANPTNASGQPQDVAAASASTVFARSASNTLEFSAVTDAMMQNQKVNRTGDTMTGVLAVNLNAAAAPTPFASTVLHIINVDGSAARMLLDTFATQSVLTFRRANGTNAAPTVIVSGDALGNINTMGYRATGYVTNARAAFAFFAAENWTDTANGTRLTFNTTANLSQTSMLRWGIENDGSFVYNGGTVTGVSTINAVDYFDNGVNINTIYAPLAVANTFTAAQTINANATFGLELRRTDNGSSGPGMKFLHETTSPALNDSVGLFNFYGRDAVATERLGGAFQVLLLDPAAATYATEARILCSEAGFHIRDTGIVTLSGGSTATGGATTGGGTINAKGYYANNQLVADSVGLLRARPYTVATLPVAPADGSVAKVADALAPVKGTALAAGGAVSTIALYSGGAWVAG